MGTSRLRTLPAPVSAEPPKGAPAAYSGTQDLENANSVSRGMKEIFVPSDLISTCPRLFSAGFEQEVRKLGENREMDRTQKPQILAAPKAWWFNSLVRNSVPAFTRRPRPQRG